MKTILLVAMIIAMLAGSDADPTFKAVLYLDQCVSYVEANGTTRTACLRDDYPDRCYVQIYYGLLPIDFMYQVGVQVLPGFEQAFPEAWDIPRIECDEKLVPLKATISSTYRMPVLYNYLPFVMR